MEADEKAKAEAKLVEDGKIQELLDSKILEVTGLQSERDKFKIVAEESTNFKAAQVKIYEKRMGSKWNDEYANLSLTALDTLVSQAVPKKVGTDLGPSGEKPDVELSEDQKRDAVAKYPHVPVEKAYEYHTHNLIKTGKIVKEK